MLDLPAIKTNIAAVAATFSITVGGSTISMYGTSPYNVHDIPGTPYFVVKNPRGTNSPGNFEILNFDLPATLYFQRLSLNESTDESVMAPWLIAFLAGFAPHTTLGGSGISPLFGPVTCTQAFIREYNMDLYYPVGDAMYHGMELIWDITVAGQGVQYTTG